MIDIKIEKTAGEKWPLETNFGVGDWKPMFDSDPIDAAQCTVTDWLGNPLSVITATAPAVSGKIVQTVLDAGTAGQTYQIRVRAVSTTNHYKADCFYTLYVRNPS